MHPTPRRFLFLLSASLLVTACASLLGADFDRVATNDAGPTGDGSGDAGVEGNGGDAQGGVDGASTDGSSADGDAGARGIARGTLVLFGGRGFVADGGYETFGDTWTFDGTTWAKVEVTPSPVPRTAASMSALGDRVVLFGGLDTKGVALNDTWIFDGATWQQVPVVHSPQGASGVNLASLSDRVVAYDGSSTWTFDGKDWTNLAISNPLPGREGAAMGSWGASVYLVGGFGNDGTPWLSDTWTFDGTAWTKVASASDGGGETYFGAVGALENWFVVTTGNCGGDTNAYPVTSYFDHTRWVSLPFVTEGAAPWGCNAPMFEIGGRLLLFDGEATSADGGTGLGASAFSRTSRTWSTVFFPGAPPNRHGQALAYVP